MIEQFLPIANKLNATIGLIVALLSYIFGRYWILFVAFFALNVLDCITGHIKSKTLGVINSSKGATGVVKKLGYWIMIVIGFGMSTVFIKIGEVIGVDLQVTSLIGWFVLASLIVNEFRSNIENLVEAGYDVPKILTEGLEVANKVLDSKIDVENEKKDGDTSFDLKK